MVFRDSVNGGVGWTSWWNVRMFVCAWLSLLLTLEFHSSGMQCILFCTLWQLILKECFVECF